MTRRLLTVAMTALFAACASPGASGPAGSSAEVTAPSNSAAAVSAPPASSAETSGQPASGADILIGISTALSGGAAAIGQDERSGANLAVEQINAKGGVGGRPLSLSFEDNACDPTQGAASITKLSGEPAVMAIVGGLCSSVTLAGMPIVAREGVPFLVGISTAPKISDLSGVGGNDWTFRINASDASLAVGLANYLAQTGVAKRLAILGEDTDYGRGGAAALTSALTAKGLTVTSTDFVAQGTQDFSALLARYASTKPDAVALFINGADHLNYVTQAKSVGLNIPVSGRAEFQGPSLPIITGGGFEGSTSAYSYTDVYDSPANAVFVAAYKAANGGTAPTAESFAGYNEISVLADAFSRASSIDRTAIRDALKTTNFQSLLGGTVKFDDHNQAHDKIVIMTIKDGKVVVAGTADS
jgi:branched-chain amino acid transport system substrate-binding protein